MGSYDPGARRGGTGGLFLKVYVAKLGYHDGRQVVISDVGFYQRVPFSTVPKGNLGRVLQNHPLCLIVQPEPSGPVWLYPGLLQQGVHLRIMIIGVIIPAFAVK